MNQLSKKGGRILKIIYHQKHMTKITFQMKYYIEKRREKAQTQITLLFFLN